MFEGFAAVEVWPSPNAQLYVRAEPSGSAVPVVEKFTVNGTLPFRGVALTITIGGRFGGPPDGGLVPKINRKPAGMFRPTLSSGFAGSNGGQGRSPNHAGLLERYKLFGIV